jgi:mannose-6-phosphate isomerase-like protein (cupin superfamily)
MIEATSKISSAAGRLNVRRKVGGNDDASVGTIVCLSARNKRIAFHSDTSATLCFVRGAGKMAFRGSSVEYHDGKWFKIPGMTAYQIFPDTDTVLLKIQKRGRASAK